MHQYIILSGLIGVLILGMLSYQTASAQFQQGGVDLPGTWYVGEGLKTGDYFSYKLCHVDYKECADFQMDFWVEGDKQVGTETKWLVQAVVYDGNKIIKGNMELGKVAPEPTGGSKELSVYRGAFKTSIVWLSAFASADSPKAFSAKSWGKIGNIGGEQILPLLIEPNGLSVQGGYFPEVVQVGWRTGGSNSKVWVVDDFPFPIKASTWTHVSEGIPPQEYRFELLDYEENIPTDPFVNIIPTDVLQQAMGCPSTEKLTTSIKKPTKNFDYQIHVFYAPENPVQNCPMKWQIKFISKYDDTEFLNQVQYDLLVVDENLNPLRSIAQEEGKLYLFSPSGQALLTNIIVDEPAGTAHYVVWIYGLAPQHLVPTTSPDYLKIDVPITASETKIPKPTPTPPPPVATALVPGWIKTTAGFWVDGFSSDGEFVNAIQFLIKEGVIVIPPTIAGTESGTEIPSWIKTTTGFWVDGFSSDDEFVAAIQWLIGNGIMKIA